MKRRECGAKDAASGARLNLGRIGGRGGVCGGAAGLEEVEHSFGGVRQRLGAAADRRRKVAEGFFDFVARRKLILLVTFAARASRPGNRKDAISGRKAAGRSAQNDSGENVR